MTASQVSNPSEFEARLLQLLKLVYLNGKHSVVF